MCVRNSQAFYPVACVVRACLTRARAFYPVARARVFSRSSSACGAFHPVARGHVSYLYVRSSWGRFTLSPWARAQRIQNRKLSLTICVGRQPREPTGGPRHPRRQGRRHPCRVAEEEAKPLCFAWSSRKAYSTFPPRSSVSSARAAEAAVEPSTLSVTVTDPGPLPTLPPVNERNERAV